MKIGVLALQGDFYKHYERLSQLEATPVEIRTSEQLHRCAGLILPGGESTTLVKLLAKSGMDTEIRTFAETRPIFGTCAGTILLANHVTDARIKPLEMIDIQVDRNAYGRQIASFIDDVQINGVPSAEVTEGVFIRAPKIISIGASVETLGTCRDEPVLVQSGNILASTFHPELSDDTLIHAFFLDYVRART